MRYVKLLLLFAVLATLATVSGCADTFTAGGVDGAQGADLSADGAVDPDAVVIGDAFVPPDGFTLGKAKVFAHTRDVLFDVDPDTLEISEIAAFGWPTTTADEMTDIAVDKDGRMIGVSQTAVYDVDPKTAVCTQLSSFPPTAVHFVGLSFVVDTSVIDSTEVLMGLDRDGGIFVVDPNTGAIDQRGTLGGGLKGSGDVVSIKSLGTFATVRPPDDDTDWLARVDPGTGKATLIGDTGVVKIWGLGYWKGRVFGFAEGGDFVLVDMTTGKATPQETGTRKWWGAGVTTEAPVIK